MDDPKMGLEEFILDTNVDMLYIYASVPTGQKLFMCFPSKTWSQLGYLIPMIY